MRVKDIPEYSLWKAMKARCYAPCNKDMGYYQKDNIQVCKEWVKDFHQFYADMGPRPSKKHSLDRIDGKKDYSKYNCRWATQTEQIKNRDHTMFIEFNGETKCLKDWARHFNLNYTTLYMRVVRGKMPFDLAIQKDPYNRLIEINGIHKTLREWCDFYGQKYMTACCRINRGWDKEEAILTPIPPTTRSST